MTQIVTFDVPSSRGTSPAAISMAGEITGNYGDSSGPSHGFVRKADGSFVTFDIPNSTPNCSFSPGGVTPGAGWQRPR